MLADLTALVGEVKGMLVALRDLARDMRDPAPKPHPLDAPPLPTFEEACKGIPEEAAAWDDLAKQFDAPPALPV